MIRILLADDQTLVRQGIRSLLEGADDLRVVSEAADGDEALRGLSEARPDVVLLDVRMPGKGGLDVLRAMRKAGDATPVILLTTFDDDSVLENAMKIGISGYLLKDVSRDQLANAVRTVAKGGRLIRPAATARAAKVLEQSPPDFESAELPDPLTPRELEVLRLMAGGLSNGEIASRLGAAEGTIRNHTSHIFSKLGVRDRTRAVLRALALGQL